MCRLTKSVQVGKVFAPKTRTSRKKTLTVFGDSKKGSVGAHSCLGHFGNTGGFRAQKTKKTIKNLESCMFR